MSQLEAGHDRVVVLGATGNIGSSLCHELKSAGYQVTVVARSVEKAEKLLPEMSRYEALNFSEPERLVQALEGARAVVNLSGTRLVAPFASSGYKRQVVTSRVQVTSQLVDLIARTSARPSVLVNASATGYYGSHELSDRQVTEASAPGEDSVARLAVDWENAAKPAEHLGVRTVLARTGIVLDTKPGSALSLMALPFRFWLGGTLGVARSWRSWIHIDDEVGLLIHAIENSNIAGPINLTAPNPVRASEFSRRLGRALHRPSWLPAPEFALRLVFGKNTETITRGLKVLPRKALEVGYSFQFPDLAPALSQLFQR